MINEMLNIHYFEENEMAIALDAFNVLLIVSALHRLFSKNTASMAMNWFA